MTNAPNPPTTTSTDASSTASTGAGLPPASASEKADLLASLALHRAFLLRTVEGLTDEQARQRTTKSELTLGPIVKHVAAMERRWVEFIVVGASAVAMPTTPEEWAAWQADWTMGEGETLQDIVDEFARVARRTEEVVDGLASLDVSHELPEAPWFEPGARWSARTALLHVLAESAQHAGHADIIRESLDGQKTMG